MVEESESIRQKVAHYLDDFDSSISIIINLILVGLIFLSSAIFVIETYPITTSFVSQLQTIDKVIIWIFTIEYLIRFWCADSKLKFIFSSYSFIDILAILPLFIGLIDIRYIRILRWFRVLRLIRLIKLQTSLLKIQSEDTIILVRIFLLLFCLIFIYAGAIYQIEHKTNPQVFKDFFDALYFSVVTMTTVGFGDIIPLSKEGKILTVIMIFSGVIFIPWQISILTQKIFQITQQNDKVCSYCGLKSHDRDANFCKICSTKL
ncbi:ion transporter [Aphanothece sacrum]|uniref:Potassium channel protein n=1 Tax=Aphanothece sacrum FPU1 TaxID=1920663 RepID=A0A401IET0_APHSA|nr:ion transporter [Aphanothece sacrum]GBF79690.1 potassium channel protein [Aphanothece sacrum FPU1]GBF87150.1 potassium channel protein [Aphanothece sacrum FPU3]